MEFDRQSGDGHFGYFDRWLVQRARIIDKYKLVTSHYVTVEDLYGSLINRRLKISRRDEVRII